MLTVLFRNLMRRDTLSEDERNALAEVIGEPRDVRAHEVLVREGKRIHASTLLVEGVACRYKDLRDGRRQISALHVPGDFMDLHSFMLKKLDHDVAMLTAGKVAVAPHDGIARITERHPHLARLLWMATLIDAAIHREQIVSIGRRSALARLAHLFRELEARLEIVGLAENGRYRLPLTQSDLADVTGLTSVHVNRMLRQLREEGLVELRSGTVQILNRAGLERAGEFDPAYLHLDGSSGD